MSFTNLGLKDSLLRAVEAEGYTTPTPIQAQAIPAILSGSDVMAAAQTGTGKTAGFTLPLLQLLGDGERARANQVRALVLTPTRELAAQVLESVRNYGHNEDLRSVVVFGGVGINPQMMAMRKGADILVATPGRLLDLYQQNAIRFDNLEILVLDEADRMLDMGFIHDIRRILKLLPGERQNLMFSATFSDEIRTLAKTICRKPVEIDVAPRNSTVEAISQRVFHVAKSDKFALLSTLLRNTADQVLVFSRTKHGANALVRKLEKDGVRAAAIHGNKSQGARTKALSDFKADKVQVLVATDIAARGIDIDQLEQVINYDLPNVPEDYVHRIGRTGRAGATGLATSLVCPDEKDFLRDIERLIKRKIAQEDPPAFTRAARSESAADDAEESRPPRQSRGRQQPRQDKEDTAAPANRRRKRSRKPVDGENRQSQSGSRRNGNHPAANDAGQEARPKRRRRSRNRTGQDAKPRSANAARQGDATPNKPASAGAIDKLKRFFGGRKVA